MAGWCFVHNNFRWYSLENTRSECATEKIELPICLRLHLSGYTCLDISGCFCNSKKNTIILTTNLYFQVLLANKLDEDIKISYTAAVSPLFISFITLILMSFSAKGGNRCNSPPNPTKKKNTYQICF